MISRAARRTNSERLPPPALPPSITALSFSRVRSDPGILPIGVLLRRGRPHAGPRLIANQAKLHPNRFSSNFRTSPERTALIGLLAGLTEHDLRTQLAFGSCDSSSRSSGSTR